MAIRRFSIAEPGVKSNRFWDQDTAQGAIEPIGLQTVTGSATQVFFNNIPQHYQDLMLVIQARQLSNTGAAVYARLNSTSHNRSYMWLEAGGSSVSTGRAVVAGDGYTQIAQIMPSNATAGYFSATVGHIFNYANPNTFKTIFGRSSIDSNGSGGVRLEVGLSQITSAITSLEIVTDGITSFAHGSTIALYGVRAEK